MEEPTTLWHPADLLSHKPKEHKKLVVVVLNQPLELPCRLYSVLWQNSSFHVGADGGANRLRDLNSLSPDLRGNLGYDLDTVIGDLDSIRPDVKEYWLETGTEVIHDPDQYSTDFEKAVKYVKLFEVPSSAELTPSRVKERQATLQAAKKDKSTKDIVCIGGLGGRVDQGMSQLHHLYKFQEDPLYRSGKMFLLSSEAITFVLKSGKHRIKVREVDPNQRPILGNHIGIIPLKEASRITTRGLKWDVTDWQTEIGGQLSTSNHVEEEWVTIETTKDVLFTIDLCIPDIS